MTNFVRAAFATVAFSALIATVPAKAQSTGVGVGVGVCIPLLGCGNNGGAASAPEISGSMLSTGVGFVTGVALLFRNRRRSSK